MMIIYGFKKHESNSCHQENITKELTYFRARCNEKQEERFL